MSIFPNEITSYNKRSIALYDLVASKILCWIIRMQFKWMWKGVITRRPCAIPQGSYSIPRRVGRKVRISMIENPANAAIPQKEIKKI